MLQTRFPSSVVSAATVMLMLCNQRTAAQQYITDDAAITEYGACQLQVWYGRRAWWFLPVCTPIKNLELSAGFAHVRAPDDAYIEGLLQAKTMLRAKPAGSLNVGAVLGTGFDAEFLGAADSGPYIYAYVPLSRVLLKDRLILHLNAGGLLDLRARESRGELIWAARADFTAFRSLVLILDTYGVSSTTSEFQVGARTWLVPDRVQVDLSYGSIFAGNGDGAGWIVGLTLISKPFLKSGKTPERPLER